jgi:hypothetical protein
MYFKIRVADPHHFNVDLDPDPDPHQSDGICREE